MTTTTTTTTATSNPPTPRRCRRIVDAHHLASQGRSLEQIAQQMGCARSTAAAYLRDFRLHRAHILQTVAADQLVDQVVLLTQPQSDPAQHRQHVATTRELRLLLSALPSLQEHERQQRERIEAERLASATALARSRHHWAEEDGHLRYPGFGQADSCKPECPTCHPELYEGENPLPPIRSLQDQAAAQRRFPHYFADPVLDEPVPTETEPEPSSYFPDDSGQIETNLDNSGPQIEEFPVLDEESPQITRNSRPPTPVGPEFPVSWDNPLGYIPPSQLISHTAYTPLGGRRSDQPPRWR